MSADARPILVTGGAGFIGSCFVRAWLAEGGPGVVNLDKLTYAGHLASLGPARDDPRHRFVKGDVTDRPLVDAVLAEHRPAAIVHLAAETHVDRSLDSPPEFVQTNVVGTFHLLEAALAYWNGLGDAERAAFRFLHVSTDEVFGCAALGTTFDERAPYAPNSPYAASKAAADHFVRAYQRTYNLPTIICNASNTFGPYQYPEKLIPLMIRRALAGKSLPLYGDGQHERQWLYVDDLCRALRMLLAGGRPGESYLVGGARLATNLEIVRAVCARIDALRPKPSCPASAERIESVADRPGHDRRYALDCHKIERELGWRPEHALDAALEATVAWYLENEAWALEVTAGDDATRRRGLARFVTGERRPGV